MIHLERFDNLGLKLAIYARLEYSSISKIKIFKFSALKIRKIYEYK